VLRFGSGCWIIEIIKSLACHAAKKVPDYSNEGMIVLYREGLSNAHGNTE
jgi:hypothetical protein